MSIWRHYHPEYRNIIKGDGFHSLRCTWCCKTSSYTTFSCYTIIQSSQAQWPSPGGCPWIKDKSTFNSRRVWSGLLKASLSEQSQKWLSSCIFHSTKGLFCGLVYQVVHFAPWTQATTKQLLNYNNWFDKLMMQCFSIACVTVLLKWLLAYLVVRCHNTQMCSSSLFLRTSCYLRLET